MLLLVGTISKVLLAVLLMIMLMISSKIEDKEDKKNASLGIGTLAILIALSWL